MSRLRLNPIECPLRGQESLRGAVGRLRRGNPLTPHPAEAIPRLLRRPAHNSTQRRSSRLPPTRRMGAIPRLGGEAWGRVRGRYRLWGHGGNADSVVGGGEGCGSCRRCGARLGDAAGVVEAAGAAAVAGGCWTAAAEAGVRASVAKEFVGRTEGRAGGVGVGWTPSPGGCGGQGPGPSGETVPAPGAARRARRPPTPTTGPARPGACPGSSCSGASAASPGGPRSRSARRRVDGVRAPLAIVTRRFGCGARIRVGVDA